VGANLLAKAIALPGEIPEVAPAERGKIKEVVLDKGDLSKNSKAKDAVVVLNAYIAAYNNKEPQKVLDDLNDEFKGKYSLKVFRRSSDNRLVVTDLSGTEIMTNRG
jgi:hypothetical protein